MILHHCLASIHKELTIHSTIAEQTLDKAEDFIHQVHAQCPRSIITMVAKGRKLFFYLLQVQREHWCLKLTTTGLHTQKMKKNSKTYLDYSNEHTESKQLTLHL